MRVNYSPQRFDSVATLAATGDLLTVSIGEQSDVFDFSGMPDGATSRIESILDPCPVLRAERVDGVLTVYVLGWYGAEPSDSDSEAHAKWALSTEEREVVI